MYELLSIGADPEVFLVTKEGTPFSAEGLFGGTKSEPKPMEGLPAGFYIQEDNVSAEYNIPPVKSARAFWQAINSGMTYIRDVAEKQGLQPLFAPDLDFPPDQLATPHAQLLGCDPDFNAWLGGKRNPRPRPPKQMRTAAGHVHLAYKKPDADADVRVIKMMDVYLGLPSVLVTPKSRRRELYGKAGAFRPKPYGSEYRTLDNFWLANADLCHEVFTASCLAVSQALNSNDLFINEVNEAGEDIQKAINEHDVELARDLVKFFQVRTFDMTTGSW